jgi:hypothetical protein
MAEPSKKDRSPVLVSTEKSPEEVQKDLQRRLMNLESSELKDNEEVQKILENIKSRHLIFDLVGVPVRTVAAFPREVRYIYERNQKRDPNMPLAFSDLEQENYKIMAKLFLDAPYNTPEFWELFDESSGMMWGTLNAVYEGIERNEQKIGEFRKK